MLCVYGAGPEANIWCQLINVDKNPRCLKTAKFILFPEYLAFHQVPIRVFSEGLWSATFPVLFSILVFNVILFSFFARYFFLFCSVFCVYFFIIQCLLVPWLQLFAHLVQKLKNGILSNWLFVEISNDHDKIIFVILLVIWHGIWFFRALFSLLSNSSFPLPGLFCR